MNSAMSHVIILQCYDRCRGTPLSMLSPNCYDLAPSKHWILALHVFQPFHNNLFPITLTISGCCIAKVSFILVHHRTVQAPRSREAARRISWCANLVPPALIEAHSWAMS